MSTQTTILLVDDEPLFVESLRDALKTHNPSLDLLTAPNGRKALQELSREDVSLLITDLKMPDLDGFGLLEHLEEYRYRGPIVVMTAYGTDDVERRAYLGGAAHVLEKPIDLDELIRLIDELTLDPSESYAVVDLGNLLPLLAAEGSTCVVRVRNSRSYAGLLGFADGVMVSAETPHADGDQAVLELLELRAPSADVRVVLPGAPHNVSRPLNDLVREATRRKESRETTRSGSSSRQTQSVDVKLTANSQSTKPEEGDSTMDVKEALAKTQEIDGFIGAAIVDYQSGITLGVVGDGRLDIDLAASGNAEVVKSKMSVMASLQLDDTIEDILITLSSQYHLIRPMAKAPNIFIYLAIGREKGNLGLARHKLKSIESDLDL